MDIIEVEFIEQELIELYDCENSLFLLTVQIENQSQEVITYFLLYAETTSTLMKTNSFIISESKVIHDYYNNKIIYYLTIILLVSRIIKKIMDCSKFSNQKII